MFFFCCGVHSWYILRTCWRQTMKLLECSGSWLKQLWLVRGRVKKRRKVWPLSILASPPQLWPELGEKISGFFVSITFRKQLNTFLSLLHVLGLYWRVFLRCLSPFPCVSYWSTGYSTSGFNKKILAISSEHTVCVWASFRHTKGFRAEKKSLKECDVRLPPPHLSLYFTHNCFFSLKFFFQKLNFN